MHGLRATVETADTLLRQSCRCGRCAEAPQETRMPDPERTKMFAEAGEAADCVRRLLAESKEPLAAIGERLRRRPPRAVLTCARGSSDHAATFAKYLIETRLGVPTASMAPSVASTYGASLHAEEMLG